MTVYICKQARDFEGYLQGNGYEKVGPFDTREAAEAWLTEHPEYSKHLYPHDTVDVRDLMSGMVSPDQWKPMVVR